MAARRDEEEARPQRRPPASSRRTLATGLPRYVLRAASHVAGAWVDAGVGLGLRASGQAFFLDGLGDLNKLPALENAHWETLSKIEQGSSSRRHGGAGPSSAAAGALQPAPIDIQWRGRGGWERWVPAGGCVVREGTFESPVAKHLLPVCRTGRVQMVLPADPATPLRGVVVHFASTADQTFLLRRKLLAEPLLKDGIVSIIHCPPFYGRRKPRGQRLHYTRTVEDFATLCAVSLTEGVALVEWVRRQDCFKNLMVGVAGFSMGGAIAANVGIMASGPLCIVTMNAPNSAERAYMEGVIGQHQVQWDKLAEQCGSHTEAAMELKAALESLTTLIERLRVRRASGGEAASRDKDVKVAIKLGSLDDRFVVADDVLDLKRALESTGIPVELRWIPGGHTSAAVVSMPTFRDAIADGFASLEAQLGDGAIQPTAAPLAAIFSSPVAPPRLASSLPRILARL